MNRLYVLFIVVAFAAAQGCTSEQTEFKPATHTSPSEVVEPTQSTPSTPPTFLASEPTALPDRQSANEERSKQGSGSGANYLTPEDIRYRNPAATTDFSALITSNTSARNLVPVNKPTDLTASTTTLVNQASAPMAKIQQKNLHSDFDRLLTRYVSANGVVDYVGLKGERSKLKDYLHKLATAKPAADESRNARLAYWINIYNAATLNLIVENYPVSSIKDIDNPWNAPRIAVGKKYYSLDQIENEIIRPTFDEPRIHFALNCAAISCPPLLNKAYQPDILDQQLEQQTKAFLNNEAFTRQAGNKLYISKIFDWYGADFGNLEAFLRRYRPLPANSNLEFAEYNWSLNH